ncbi:unnamed protein product [Tetraodon nigroviridis]|uniref:(spotted green pufferfish) hypothetical protein n=1 Tax=Tetraodon nigroviridis TaxID=99883 RepID=Q4SUX5_TETNG|nr:unnamed protein product [Tetraodon nigroviridis]
MTPSGSVSSLRMNLGTLAVQGGCGCWWLFLVPAGWTRTRPDEGAVEPTSSQGGPRRAAAGLPGNLPHQFSCRSEGWDPHNRPLGQSEVIPSGDRPNSTFSLRPRKWSRELVCEASNPRTGQKFNASVTLSLQLKPEILGVDANQSSDPGLVLVLFALVRSSPPATVSFVDQSGQLVANTSDFLLLDSQTHPWLANHTLRILLSSLSGNLSLKLSHSVGPVQSNLTLAEFLQSRVEVPMLGIVTGGAMALMALLTLTFILLCLMQKNKSKSLGFARYPMVGYIYKVNSTSSEEIWL